MNLFKSVRNLLYGLEIVMLAALTAVVVQAGSVLDFGQLTGLPERANYVAWVGAIDAVTPNELLTEDGYNSQAGLDQGYQNGIWYLSATNFSSQPADGAQIHFVFGGLGSNSGTIWRYSIAPYDLDNSTTNHGIVAEETAGSCPTMLSGSWDGTEKLIRWSAPAGTYLIYRSVNPSGGDNDNSNGRYQYIATVNTGTSEGSYTDTVNVPSWHIVVPATAAGAINGCHSEESNPTAVNLSRFQAVGVSAVPVIILLLLGGIGLTAVALRTTRFR